VACGQESAITAAYPCRRAGTSTTCAPRRRPYRPGSPATRCRVSTSGSRSSTEPGAPLGPSNASVHRTAAALRTSFSLRSRRISPRLLAKSGADSLPMRRLHTPRSAPQQPAATTPRKTERAAEAFWVASRAACVVVQGPSTGGTSRRPRFPSARIEAGEVCLLPDNLFPVRRPAA
jgi:hypothetical protein